MTPKDVKNLITTIIIIAEMDGTISEDELKIIDQVKIDGKKYEHLFNEIKARETVNDDDIQALERAKMRILKNATNAAGEDALITADERRILLKILEIINDPDFS